MKCRKSDLNKIAQIYAEKAGWKVHPVRLNKVAFLNDWPNVASDDVEDVDKMWGNHPGASIGVVCGKPSGIWVLDVDLPDGPKNLSLLEEKYGKLPETLMQQTGSGGFQYFWKYNGIDIRNSTSKIAKNLDTRGNGGYVIVAPSPHPSGNFYKWLNKAPILPPPEWLVSLINKPKQTRQRTYGQAALSDELARLGTSVAGNRNMTLNEAAFSLGQLVAGGELDYASVEGALLGVAISIGLNEREARKTIESGMRAGGLSPRSVSHDNDFGHLTDKEIGLLTTFDDNDDRHQEYDDKSQHTDDTLTTSCRQHDDSLTTESGYSLAERINDWITNAAGSFTNQDIDREFCLTTRNEKQNRSKICERLYMARKIKKDKRKKGLWHVVDQVIDFVDLDADEPTSFPIRLPFDIHKFVKIPPKAVILLAGSSNAGKTAFALNTLRMNLDQDYNRLYLMSEMGGGEYKTRIQAFGDGLEPWRNVQAASKSYDFDGAILNHNPDGLTVIDYLEEVDGEYFKIPTDIRNIYDSIGNGVAIVAIQKRTDQDFARGGQGTIEKARLAMNLDYLATGDRCIICSLKMAKVKHFLERNLQGHEIHFKLEMGCKVTPLTDWMLSSRVNRKKYIQQYEAGNDNPTGDDLFFRTKGGDSKRIVAKDILKWQETFTNIDVYEELSRIAGDSVQKPFLADKGWFFQLSGILKKKNGGI